MFENINSSWYLLQRLQDCEGPMMHVEMKCLNGNINRIEITSCDFYQCVSVLTLLSGHFYI